MLLQSPVSGRGIKTGQGLLVKMPSPLSETVSSEPIILSQCQRSLSTIVLGFCQMAIFPSELIFACHSDFNTSHFLILMALLISFPGYLIRYPCLNSLADIDGKQLGKRGERTHFIQVINLALSPCFSCGLTATFWTMHLNILLHKYYTRRVCLHCLFS